MAEETQLLVKSKVGFSHLAADYVKLHFPSFTGDIRRTSFYIKILYNNLEKFFPRELFDDYGAVTDALIQTTSQGIYRFKKDECLNVPPGVLGGTILTMVVSGKNTSTEVMCSVRILFGYAGGSVNLYSSMFSAGESYGVWKMI